MSTPSKSALPSPDPSPSASNRGRIRIALSKLRAAPGRCLAAGTVALLCANAAFAALPTNPTGTNLQGNYLENMRDYVGMFFGLLALLLAGFAFLTVAGGSITKFNEWRAGKAELGDLKMVFMIGGLLLIVVIWLVTQLVGIISTSAAFANG
jgi:integrating conjugative element membrane protein (TIGR03745 family)